ncbi:MAG: MMPL family transporter [Thiotrichaceae bacterium]|nr:MMPL family transporter [Thiotrichaceae bacterium]
MKQFLQLSSRHPWLILLSLICITLLVSTRLSDLTIQISAESLSVEDDPAWISYQKSLKNFDNSSITVVLFEDKELFTTNKLTQIQSVIGSLSAISEVSKTTSLFSVSNIRLEDEYIITKPFLETIPDSTEQLNIILKQASLNPLVINNLITENGQVFAVNLTLKNDNNDPKFDSRVSQAIESVLSENRSHFDSLIQIGSPLIRDTITRKISSDQTSIMPWVVVIIMLVLAIGIRSFSGAFIPIFTAGISIIWTLAGMALMDIPISVMTSIVPVLLIIIGSTEDIHIIADYRANCSAGLTSNEALDKMSSSIGIAILLTFITTYFGFISIYTNEIKLLQEFGLVASSGLLINFIVTSLSVPAILKILPEKKHKSGHVTNSSNIYQRAALFIFNLALKYTRSTILIFLLITIISIVGALSLKVNNNPLGYFKNDTEVVINSHKLHEALAGVETFSIIIETGIEDTFKKVRYLEEIEKIQQYLTSSKLFDKSLSFNDFIKVIHLVMQEDEVEKIEYLYLPDSDDLIREYMLFIKHELVKSYVTEEFDSSRILVRHAINDSSELKVAIQNLELFIQHNIDPALKVSVTGASIVRANGADYMAAGQAKSLILMSLVIISVVAILFVNWKAGLVALIPNLFPIIVLFGVMGFADIALDTGTAMVAVIALGICVDDTVHFMTRYHHNTRNHNNPEKALSDTVADESVPIITTSLALMAGFGALTLSSFVPIINFGLLSAMVMLLAMITTFIITPLLLSYISLITMWDMLSLNLQAKVINDCPLFKGLSPWSIKQTILMSEVKNYAAGETIIAQGSIGDEMYVILEGDVSVQIVRENCSMVTVNESTVGSLFGEIALISDVPRTASVVAKTNSRLLTLKWDSIKRISKFHTRISTQLFQNLASIVGNRLSNTESLTAIKDECSGAINSTIFKELVNMEISRSQRYKEPLSFVCFTIISKLDNKQFNDMLRLLSNEIKNNNREVDVYARWGDYRFVILLPRTDLPHANNIAKRIQDNISKILAQYTQNPELKMTTWSYDGIEKREALIEKMIAILDSPITKSIS